MQSSHHVLAMCNSHSIIMLLLWMSQDPQQQRLLTTLDRFSLAASKIDNRHSVKNYLPIPISCLRNFTQTNPRSLGGWGRGTSDHLPRPPPPLQSKYRATGSLWRCWVDAKLSLLHSTMQESAADFKGKWLRVRGSYNRRWGRRRSNRMAGKEGDFVSVFLSYAQRHSWSEVRAIRQTNLSRVRVCVFVTQT